MTVCGRATAHTSSTLRPRQNGRRFQDILKCVFLNENVWISIKISLKLLPKGPISAMPVLVPGCKVPTFLAATKQLYEWYFLSVCPSVTPFWLCSHHRIIMKFSGVITTDQGKVHAKGQGQRSKVKVTEVTTQLNRFRTVTPVWIHIWWWNDTYKKIKKKKKMIYIAWCCLGEVPYCFSRSSVKFQGHTALKSSNLTQIGRFRTITQVLIHQWLQNDAQSLK